MYGPVKGRGRVRGHGRASTLPGPFTLPRPFTGFSPRPAGFPLPYRVVAGPGAGVQNTTAGVTSARAAGSRFVFLPMVEGHRDASDSRPQLPLRSRSHERPRAHPPRDAPRDGGSPLVRLPGADASPVPRPEEGLQDHDRSGVSFP